MGGIAELKRRKQEKELAERGGAGAGAGAGTDADAGAVEEENESKPYETAEAPQPGQLKHVSLRTRHFYPVARKGDSGITRAFGSP